MEMFVLYVRATHPNIVDAKHPGIRFAPAEFQHIFPDTSEHAARRRLLDWYLANGYEVVSISKLPQPKEVKRKRRK